jgi:isochorismate synthase EntC
MKTRDMGPPCLAVGHQPGGLPPPLWRAQRILHDALAELAAPPASAREVGYLRVEVEVSGAVREPLFWLQLQPIFPRVYFRDRHRGVCVAGVGECVGVRGDGELDADAAGWPPVDLWHERMRLVGGGRFDAHRAADADWAAYGGYRFVLPAVEVQRHNGRTYFACHLRWDPASEASWERARFGALNTLHRCVPSAEPTVSHLPYVEAEEERTSREDWRRAVERVFGVFDETAATKVVLARR